MDRSKLNGQRAIQNLPSLASGVNRSDAHHCLPAERSPGVLHVGVAEPWGLLGGHISLSCQGSTRCEDDGSQDSLWRDSPPLVVFRAVGRLPCSHRHRSAICFVGWLEEGAVGGVCFRGACLIRLEQQSQYAACQTSQKSVNGRHLIG